jgi:hypothetical protein
VANRVIAAITRWRPGRRQREAGWPAWSGPLVGATFLAGVGGAVARSEHAYPRPGASADDIDQYFTQPSGAPWISVAGQLLSAAALVAWTTRVVRLGRGSRALQATACAGGAISAGSLATSAACAATLASRSHSARRAISVHRAAFLAGGPTHGAGFGLLLAALGLADRRAGRLPAPLAQASLISAAPNLLSPAYLAWSPAAWLIPAGRFPGLIITAIAGSRLARAS